MAVTYRTRYKVVAHIATRPNISESQIRGYLAAFESAASAFIQTIVDAAPPVAQATLDSVVWVLKVDSPAAGIWDIYPKPEITITVADAISRPQIDAFLRGYLDDAKAQIGTLLAGTPPGAQVSLLGWHIHRVDAAGVESESDEAGP